MRNIITRACIYHPSGDTLRMEWGAVYDYAGKAGVNQDCPRLAQRGHHTLYKRTQVCKGKRQRLASPGVFFSCDASQLKRKDSCLVDETS